MWRELDHLGLSVVVATKHHALDVARMMRPQDRAEVYASGRMMPEQAARVSINTSQGEAWAGYAGRDLLCVFGVRSFPSGWDVPWFLGTIYLEKHARTFWQASKLVLSVLRSKHPQMVQMIHAKNDVALRWVRHLGFKVEPPEPFGAFNEFFCRISMITRALITEGAELRGG